MSTIIQILQFHHVGTLLAHWAVTAWRLLLLSLTVIQVIVQLLVPRLVINIGNSCGLDTLTRILVHILEGVLIEVNRRGSETLRRRLLTSKLPTTSSHTFETSSNLLCR